MTFLDQPPTAFQPLQRFADHRAVNDCSPRVPVGRRAIAVPIEPHHLAGGLVAKANAAAFLCLWCLIALLVVTLLGSSQAWGQAAGGFKNVPLPQVPKATISAMERAKSEGLTKGDLTPQWSGFEDLRKYYVYQFAKLKDSAQSASYGKIMQSMLDDLERTQRARTPAARHVVGWIIAGAGAIASENYHPAARVNATLLLALVDDQGADLREGKPAVPAQAALVPLVRLYRTDTNPDGVRAAALQGIARHVTLGAVPQQYRKSIADMMLQLASSDPPSGRSPEAHAYLQRYAVDILTVLANPNVAEQTTQTLVSLSTASEKPSLISAYAAAKIGQLQPGKGKVQNPSRVLKSWAARAAAAIDGELDRIARLDPPKAVRDQPAMPTEQSPRPMGYGPGAEMDMSGSYGMESALYESSSDYTMEMPSSDYMMMEGYGAMMGEGGMMMPRAKPQPVEVIASRRRINHVLQQLQIGVTGRAVPGKPRQPAGLLVAATENDQAAFDAWIKTVSDVVTAINVDTLDDRKKFVEALQEQSLVLKKLAGIDTKPANGTAPLDFNGMPAMEELGGPAAVPGNPPVAVPAAGGANAPGVVNAPAQPQPAQPQPAQPPVEPDFNDQLDAALAP